MMTDEQEPTETTTLNVGAPEEGDTTEVAMVTVTNEHASLPSPHCVTSTQHDPDTAEESHLQCTPNKDVKYVVMVRFDDRYLKTLPGILKFIQVIFSVIGLICLTSSGLGDAGYLLLPLAWHLRAYVFVSVCGTLVGVLGLLLQITGLVSVLPINWPLFDMCTYATLSFLYLVATSLVASAIDFYQKLSNNVTHWTEEQLIVAVVLGYTCLFLYGASSVLGYRRWRGVGQFRRYRLKNQSTQRNSRQNTV